jgi:hypothetical protein
VDLYNEILHWSLGVITSAEPDDEQIKHALVRADNMQFTSIAAGKARPRTRKGMTLVNQTPYSNTSATAGPAIIGGGVYPYKSGGSTTHYIVIVSQDGDVHFLLDDGSTTSLAATASFNGALTNNLDLPSMAVMNNRLFAVDEEGGQFSAKGTTEVDWGVATVSGLALLGAGVGNMNGDYEIKVTGYNSQIAAESDLSAAVTVTGLVNNQLQITVNAVANGLTHRFFRVYIRKATLGSGFFRVLSGTGYDATQQGFPLYAAGATTSTTIDLSDATITALTTVPPQSGANGLPPSGIKALAVWERRLFAVDNDNIYWSELDKPDSFNSLSYEPIKSRDPRGGDVVGMIVHNKNLHIFTETARIVLSGGTDRATWQWDTADDTRGASSSRAMVTHEGWLYWWDKEVGPLAMSPDDEIISIGHELIRDSITHEVLNFSRAWEVAVTAGDGRVLFAVPEVSRTRLTKILSFHTELNRWESTRWDGMDSAVIFRALATDKHETLYLGNYNGQLFRMMHGGNDGVRTGTSSGTFVAAATSTTSISDAGASFDIAGAGLIERKVTILDSTGKPVTTTSRPRITANTATSLTLSDAVSDLVVGDTYTYLIGGPDFIAETYWDSMGQPFNRKRFDRLFLQFRADTGAANVNIGIARNRDTTGQTETQLTDATGSMWDAADWDVFLWDSPNDVTYSLPVIKSGLSYRIQMRSPYPDQGFIWLKMAMLAKERGDRYRRGY